MNVINKLFICLFLSLSISSIAQNCILPNQFQGYSEHNMSVEISELFLSSLPLNSPSAYIVVLTDSNVVVGSKLVYGLIQSSIVISGDDPTADFIGATDGDEIRLQLVQNELVYDIITPSVLIFIENSNVAINTGVLFQIHCSTTGLNSDVYGCTEPLSINYNESATFNDLSCIPIVSGCNDTLYVDYQYDINTIDSSACETLITYGCINPYACNYDEDALIEDNTCVFSGTILDCNGVCIADFDLDGICDSDEIYGCDNQMYLEFDSIVTENNGTCISQIIWGCTYPDFHEYNDLATNDDSSCVTLIIVACSDSTYFEFNENTTIVDSTLCLNLIVLGCINSNYIEYNPNANMSDGSCNDLVIFGCMNSFYLEYNPNANINIDNAMCINLIVEGCLNIDACNYNESANVADESCYIFDVNLIYNEDDLLIDVVTDAENPSYNWTYSLQGVYQDLDVTSSTYSPQNNGSYIVEVVNDSNCAVSSQINMFTLQTTSVILEPSIRTFPNPVNDVLHIELEFVLTNIEIQIINNLGTELLSRRLESYGFGFNLNVSELSSGMYFLKLNNSQHSIAWIKN